LVNSHELTFVNEWFTKKNHYYHWKYCDGGGRSIIKGRGENINIIRVLSVIKNNSWISGLPITDLDLPRPPNCLSNST
jgi:hypothetical protein